MSEYIKISLLGTWFIVLIYWIISGLRVKSMEKADNSFRNFLFYWLPVLIGVFLLGPGEWFGHTWLREKFVEHTDTVGLIGLSFCVAGAIISCWARYSLGANWSLSVQRKENHELVKDGIYKVVRHPIYLGLLSLFTGNAIIVGDYRAIIAVIIILISFLFKIQKEEKVMMELFGGEYEEYRRSTKSLIPYIY